MNLSFTCDISNTTSVDRLTSYSDSRSRNGLHYRSRKSLGANTAIATADDEKLGGFTLTTTVLYLSLAVHNQTRLRQSALLHQQAHILNSITEPEATLAPQRNREVKAGLVETAKDMWNAELEREVRLLQNVDWHSLWERTEENISSLYRKAFQSGRDAIPDPPKKS